MTSKFRAIGIDKRLPIVSKTIFVREYCEKCGQYTQDKVEIIANELSSVMASFDLVCGNKKCKAKLKHMVTIVMPKKI